MMTRAKLQRALDAYRAADAEYCDAFRAWLNLRRPGGNTDADSLQIAEALVQTLRTTRDVQASTLALAVALFLGSSEAKR